MHSYNLISITAPLVAACAPPCPLSSPPGGTRMVFCSCFYVYCRCIARAYNFPSVEGSSKARRFLCALRLLLVRCAMAFVVGRRVS